MLVLGLEAFFRELQLASDTLVFYFEDAVAAFLVISVFFFKDAVKI